MKQTETLTREALARRLEAWAARIRKGEPVRVGGASVALPQRLTVETELERGRLETELEIELSWPARSLREEPLVAILTGSPNDLEKIQPAQETLKALGIPCEVRVLSAHRTPDLTVDYVRSAEARGIEVLIACAGLAAHLAGVVAAHTVLPVIGVPLAAGTFGGLDSLLSTVQMPPGIPVATVSVDGAKNAAFLAARMVGLKYPEVQSHLRAAAAAERARYEKLLGQPARKAR